MKKKCKCGAGLAGKATRCKACNAAYAAKVRCKPQLQIVIVELEDEDDVSAPPAWAVVVLPNAAAKKLSIEYAGDKLGLKETAVGPYESLQAAEAKAAELNEALEAWFE